MKELLTVENMMMVAFIVALGLSLWKVYAFLPTKVLEDDDTTDEATTELTQLFYLSLKEMCKEKDKLTSKAVYDNMITLPTFDAKKFWRFNPNRLNGLIQKELLIQKKSSLKELCS